jgi:hypothetical protein
MGRHRVKPVKFPVEKRSKHQIIAATVTSGGNFEMVLWFYGFMGRSFGVALRRQ